MGVQAETDAVDRAAGRDEREREAHTDRFPPLLREGPVGVLDDLLDHRPVFRRRRHGYDRLQVDNYVTWAESELASARRYADHLLARYGECAAQVELARRESAAPHREVDLSAVSDRLGELLRLAADEAAEVTAAGVDEAERIVSEARQEAEARLANVAVLREAAAAAVAEAHQDRAAAAEVLRQARAQAAVLLEEAAAERSRLAAEAAAGLATVQAEVDDLRRQRDEAHQSLRRLTDGIGQALQAVDVRVTGNFVAPAPGTQPVG